MLELIYDLFTRLEANRELDSEDRKLIMELSPLDKQRLENAYQTGFRRGKRLRIENFLRFRFGELDDKLSAVIEAFLDIPVE